MEILTLLKANLTHKKGSFVSILVLILIIATVLTSALSIKSNMNTRAEEAHKAVGTGDLVLYTESKQLTDEMLAKTKACECVDRIRVDNVMQMRSAFLNKKEFTSRIFIQCFGNNLYPYEVFDTDGTSFVNKKVNLQDNDVLAPISMKDTYSCNIGDTITFDIGSEKIDLQIKGFMEEPMAGSNVMGIKNIVVSETIFHKIRVLSKIEEHPDNKFIWDGKLVHIFAKQEYLNKIEDLSKEINNASNIVSLSYTSMTKEQTINYTLLITNIMCGVLLGFVAILFIVVILVLSNTINSNIEMDYVNIGILKSQGFTKAQIRLVFLIQYLLSGILGALIGILLAIPLVRMLRNLFINTSGLLFSGNIALTSSVSSLLIILLLLAIFILVKTRKVSKITPIHAIAGGVDDVYFKNVIETPVMGKSKSLLNLKLAFRQVTTNTSWYIGACLIIGLLCSFLCMTASFKETFTEKYYNDLFGVVMGDIEIEYPDTVKNEAQIESTIASISPIKSKFHNDSVYALLEGEQTLMQVLDDTSLFTSILEGRAPKYDNEIVITNVVSKQIDKHVGDTVIIQHKETKQEYIISGIYDSCADLGRCLGISLDGVYRVMPDYKPKLFQYFLEDSVKAQQIIQKINTAYSNSNNITAKKPLNMNQSSIDSLMVSSNVVMLFICFISLLFVVIVICMICNKMFLKERQSLGIYKAFGFTSNNLRFQYCFRFLLTAVIGCILGAIVFLLFGNKIDSAMLSLAGITSFEAPVTWFNLGLPILIICLTVFLSSFVTMKKVKKVDVKTLIVE